MTTNTSTPLITSSSSSHPQKLSPEANVTTVDQYAKPDTWVDTPDFNAYLAEVYPDLAGMDEADLFKQFEVDWKPVEPWLVIEDQEEGGGGPDDGEDEGVRAVAEERDEERDGSGQPGPPDMWSSAGEVDATG